MRDLELDGLKVATYDGPFDFALDSLFPLSDLTRDKVHVLAHAIAAAGDVGLRVKLNRDPAWTLLFIGFHLATKYEDCRDRVAAYLTVDEQSANWQLVREYVWGSNK